jgi:hypothetical protein
LPNAGVLEMLFNKVSIIDVLENQKREINVRIQSLDPNYVLTTSEDDLVAWLIEGLRFDLPVLDEEGISVDYGEKQIDVSRDPMRFITDRSRPFFLAGTQVTFIIPFAGDAHWFDIQPQNFTFSSGGSKAEAVHNEIHVTYAGTNLEGAAAKLRFEEELRLLKQNLQSLQTAADRRNGELEQEIRGQVRQRKEKLLRDAQMAASIGFPVRRRDGVPATYAVAVQKRKPKISRPSSSTGKFKPEPVLAMEEYENILGIIRSMVHVMERSPKAFETMGEEDMRTQFLVQLNGQYEGRATGETFNAEGKTDILIRAEDRNVFIAECKIWKGEKQLLDAIDQLLSYLCWRDTKAALIIFSRNATFSEVLGKIPEIISKHDCYKRQLNDPDESSFRYVFCQPGDRNRELILTVMAFNVPRPS